MSSSTMSMDMASSTSAMAMSTTMPSMATSTSSSMDMHMDSSSMMQMTFTTHFLDTSVLFNNLASHSAAQAFGVWLLFFFVAFLYRGLVFVRTYLEAKYWSPNAFGLGGGSIGKKASMFSDTNVDRKSDEMDAGSARQSMQQLSQPFKLQREVGRMLVAFVTMMFAYALMLIVMSFVVAWFFAVITGYAVGEFVFARLTSGTTVGIVHH